MSLMEFLNGTLQYSKVMPVPAIATGPMCSWNMNLYTRSFCKRLGWDIYQCTHLASPGEQEWMSSFQTFYSRPSWEMQRGADSLHLWVCLNINIRCTSVYPIPGIYHHFPICSPLKFIKVAFFLAKNQQFWTQKRDPPGDGVDSWVVRLEEAVWMITLWW